jgi:hypothetical protein
MQRQAINCVTIFCLALAFVIAPLRASHAERTQAMQSSAPQTLVCVVSGEGDAEMSMDAVVIVDHGKLKAPYDEESEAAQQKFAAEYFPAGRNFRLLSGGGEFGTATVKKADRGCNNLHASVAVVTSAKLDGKVMVLATNSESLGRKTGARRSPTEAERVAAIELAKHIYKSKGANAALLRKLETTNLTATDLDHDGKYELVGSFVIKIGKRLRRDLFLIAEPQAAGYKAALANYEAYKLPPEGFDSAITYVDQLDLDGDGVAEVFAIQGGFDAYGYKIFKRQAGRWQAVYSMIGDAC